MEPKEDSNRSHNHNKVGESDLKAFDDYLLGKRSILEALLEHSKTKILEDFNSKKNNLFQKAKQSGQSKDQVVSQILSFNDK